MRASPKGVEAVTEIGEEAPAPRSVALRCAPGGPASRSGRRSHPQPPSVRPGEA